MVLLEKIFRRNETPEQKAMRLHRRHLYWRMATTREGNEILRHAWELSKNPEFAHLSNSELIRLAYWGEPGQEEHIPGVTRQVTA